MEEDLQGLKLRRRQNRKRRRLNALRRTKTGKRWRETGKRMKEGRGTGRGTRRGLRMTATIKEMWTEMKDDMVTETEEMIKVTGWKDLITGIEEEVTPHM